MPCAEASTFVNRVVLATPTIEVGEFRCTLDDPNFEDSGPIVRDCFVFPRVAVAIQHEHESAFVANPNVITFYNAGQQYRRQPISSDGDQCDWFAVDRQTVGEVLEDAGLDHSSAGPFSWSRGPADAGAYLEHENVLAIVSRSGRIRAGDSAEGDSVEIEERVILLLEQAVRAAKASASASSRTNFRLGTRDAIHHVEVLLSSRPNAPWQLADLARRAGLSVFHLCRAFRVLTGRTIHHYRQQLRLRAALAAVRAGERPLTDIALDAGFCSHSHFTSAFRREFGRSPSIMRRDFLK